MSKAKKVSDTWKKLGMDLAECETTRLYSGALNGRIETAIAPQPYASIQLYRRARALRRKQKANSKSKGK